ncbi:MAG TPA: putative porin [Candidatus Acidoferrum sp.]|jgi:hypothetical protein|nr:putative porin [Candidatus Acidoferrum sp.]
MHDQLSKNCAIIRGRTILGLISLAQPLGALLGFLLVLVANSARSATPSDPVLELLLEKGVVTQEEVDKARAQAEAIRTNALNAAMPPMESKWKISNAIKNVELFGDLRLRYEHRQVNTPVRDRLELDRGRYAVRLGIRGDALSDIYYGLRLDTASNPRSPWVTFGTSSSAAPYHGPFGKSNGGINIGQVYLGWRPESWVDITLGKMPNPLYTTAMVWDSDLAPEGAAERFKYDVGPAQFFATFGQFLYADLNPTYASGGLGINGIVGQKSNQIFMFAWQAGLFYQITKDLSVKLAGTIYDYAGVRPGGLTPFFGDTYVGEGSYLGPGTGTFNGNSGWTPGSSGLFNGFPNNQGGLNHLLVLEVPFEVNFRLNNLNARVFGDYSYNLEGSQRAREAAAAYSSYLALNNATISGFAPQSHDVKAYQAGLAFGNKDSFGLVYGSTSRKHGWELRTYWQHIEQYALDPNLIDSDFFEGRANLEGIFAAAAYGFTENTIWTIRYGYARRVNGKLGTGGSNQDIPQVNPIDHYSLLQMDVTLRF